MDLSNQQFCADDVTPGDFENLLQRAQNPPISGEDLRIFETSKSNSAVPTQQSFNARVQAAVDAFRAPMVQPEFAAAFMKAGVPDESRCRRQFWSYALGYLSPFQCNRKFKEVQKRAEYRNYVQDLLALPILTNQQLSANHQKYSNQIVKDLFRTQQQLAFYIGDHDYCDYKDCLLEHSFQNQIMKPMPSRNMSSLYRILYIYSQLNIEHYTQGQNELVAMLFMVFKKENPHLKNVEVEADVFFCFQQMMQQMRALFSLQEDKTPEGIFAAMARLDHFVSVLSPRTHKLLKRLEIIPENYAISWVTSIFCQELLFPDCVRLWDSVLSYCFLEQFDCSQLFAGYGYSVEQQNYLKKVSNVKKEKPYIPIVKKYQQMNLNDYVSPQWIDFILCFSVAVLDNEVSKWKPDTDLGCALAILNGKDMFNDIDLDGLLKRSGEFMLQISKKFKKQ